MSATYLEKCFRFLRSDQGEVQCIKNITLIKNFRSYFPLSFMNFVWCIYLKIFEVYHDFVQVDRSDQGDVQCTRTVTIDYSIGDGHISPATLLKVAVTLTN